VFSVEFTLACSKWGDLPPITIPMCKLEFVFN
jgi:hypothetical protein